MQLYVIRRPSAWANSAETESSRRLSTHVGDQVMPDRIRWIRSYVVHEPDGRVGTFCVYQAVDGDAIRDHSRRAGIPGEEFYPVAQTLIVRPDPLRSDLLLQPV